jgi:hypothetical protein
VAWPSVVGGAAANRAAGLAVGWRLHASSSKLMGSSAGQERKIIIEKKKIQRENRRNGSRPAV